MQSYQPYTYQPLLNYYYNGAQHSDAVNQFTAWLKRAAPAAYNRVVQSSPGLLDAAKQVRSGTMGLSGMQMAAVAAMGEGETPDSPITQWGNQLLELAKGWMAYDAQRDLLKVNIARAEKGLPPISSSAVAPQVNVGVSPELQSLGTVALVALVGIGLFAAIKR